MAKKKSKVTGKIEIPFEIGIVIEDTEEFKEESIKSQISLDDQKMGLIVNHGASTVGTLSAKISASGIKLSDAKVTFDD